MTNQFPQPKSKDAVLGQENEVHGALVAQLGLMVRARYPLLYIVSVEEEPVEEVLNRVAEQIEPKRQLLIWDIVRGWNDNGDNKNSVMGALNRVSKHGEGTLFVLKIVRWFLKVIVYYNL